MNLTSVSLFHLPKCGNIRPEPQNLALQILVFILRVSVLVWLCVYLCVCAGARVFAEHARLCLGRSETSGQFTPVWH